MRILIDTHVFLWLFEGSLSKKTEDLLRDTLQNEIYVSHVSAWEISIKYGVGKLKLPDVPELFVTDRIRRANFTQLPIEISHVLRVHNLPPIHKDPFDRLLVSQAQSENITILTADRNIPKYQVKTLDVNNF